MKCKDTEQLTLAISSNDNLGYVIPDKPKHSFKE